MGKDQIMFKIGELVFAKVRGYPPWPAKITSVIDGRPNNYKYGVHFFGTSETAAVFHKDICLYKENKERLGKPGKRRFFKEGIEEIEQEIRESEEREVEEGEVEEEEEEEEVEEGELEEGEVEEEEIEIDGEVELDGEYEDGEELEEEELEEEELEEEEVGEVQGSAEITVEFLPDGSPIVVTSTDDVAMEEDNDEEAKFRQNRRGRSSEGFQDMEKGNTGEQVGNGDGGVKTDKLEKGEKNDRVEKTGKKNKAEKTGKNDKAEKTGKSDNNGVKLGKKYPAEKVLKRIEPEKIEKQDPGEKIAKKDKLEEIEKRNLAEKVGKEQNQGKIVKGQKGGQGEGEIKGVKAVRGVKGIRGEKIDKVDKGEKPEGTKKRHSKAEIVEVATKLEQTSRSGRVIRPKKFLGEDEADEEARSRSKPQPSTSTAEPYSPPIATVIRREKILKKATIKELVKSRSHVFGQDMGRIMWAKTKCGQMVQIKLDCDRPVTFKDDRARLMWERATEINAKRLKAEIEAGEISRDDIKLQLRPTEEQKASLSETELFEMKRVRLMERKRGKLRWLKLETRLVDIDVLIKTCLQKNKVDIEKALCLIDELINMPLDPLMLKKHPQVVDTTKKLRQYIGNTAEWNYTQEEAEAFDALALKVRQKANSLFNKYTSLFAVPETSNFWNFFLEAVNEFSKLTQDMPRERVFGLIIDPSSPYFKDVCEDDKEEEEFKLKYNNMLADKYPAKRKAREPEENQE